MFDWYLDWDYELAAAQLVFAMIGMGATLKGTDFRGVVREPKALLVGLASQFLVMPTLVLLTFAFSTFEPGIAIGLALIASLPGGALSNVVVYLGRGHVPLSVSRTALMSLICLVSTPLLFTFLFPGEDTAPVAMPRGRVVTEMLAFLLVPLGLGMLIHRYWLARSAAISKLSIRMSLGLLLVIVIGSFTSGRIDLASQDWRSTGLIILLAIATTYLTKLVAILARFDFAWAHTLAVETTLKNINLGVLLVASLFTHLTVEGGLVMYTLLVCGGAALGTFLVDAAVTRHLVSIGAKGPFGRVPKA